MILLIVIHIPQAIANYYFILIIEALLRNIAGVKKVISRLSQSTYISQVQRHQCFYGYNLKYLALQNVITIDDCFNAVLCCACQFSVLQSYTTCIVSTVDSCKGKA
jgi:hypothetical protein